jgi:hypothetical protein
MMAVISASGRTNALYQQPSAPNTQRNRALHINSMLLLTTPLARFALSRPFPWACYAPSPERVPPNELLRSAGPCALVLRWPATWSMPPDAQQLGWHGAEGGAGAGAHRPNSACGAITDVLPRLLPLARVWGCPQGRRTMSHRPSAPAFCQRICPTRKFGQVSAC